jgi:methylmalonyl-CoA mutase
MQPKLLAEFPSVSYDAWRAQVDKDLKGADFDKRLLTRTLEGIVVQPLYTARDGSPEADTAGFAGLPPYRRGGALIGQYGARWDVRAEHSAPEAAKAKEDIAQDLQGGAKSLWLRFDAQARTGDPARTEADGIRLTSQSELATVLGAVDLTQTYVALDAGGSLAAAALFLAYASPERVASAALRGSLGCDPLGAFARDGALPYDLASVKSSLGELGHHVAQQHPQLRAATVGSDIYHLAGADSVQELGYALATGVEYLRAFTEAGLTVDQASALLQFRVAVASDLFLELAKLRALRTCWAKVVAAHGGSSAGQNTEIHAVTSARTKTRRDPWVNMLRTTTEAFAAMVGGADAVTTRGFDERLGRSDPFARRIARNVQTILNEEAHVTQVADAAGGSYYVESLTDQLARAAWRSLQEVESQGGMSAALGSGAIARALEATARAREQAVSKRSAPITGVSEFAHLGEEPVKREAPTPVPARARANSADQRVEAALSQLGKAAVGQRFAALVAAAQAGATLTPLTAAWAAGKTPARSSALPIRPAAAGFEALRDRCDKHVASGGQAPRVFLCNLGPIPKHKPRSSFATGFFNAGGVTVLDNDGFADAAAAVAAFAASGSEVAVLCGSDDQYPEWVPTLVPALRERGARQIILAGRPGEREAQFQQAGVGSFIYVGADVIASVSRVLDGMGVAP